MEDYNVKQSRINLDSKLKNTMLNRCININEYLLNPENNRITIYPSVGQNLSFYAGEYMKPLPGWSLRVC